MRLLVVTDIHGNLPALEAILASRAAQRCDGVLSLGDHTGFGPQPREVHDRLTGLGAAMLLGNHEDRLNHAAEEQFSTPNWALLQWTREQMAGTDTLLPTDRRIGSLLFTHAAPGDPYRSLNERTIPDVLDALPDGVTALISGHIHAPWRVEHHRRLAVNPGAAGMAEDGRGGLARFAVVDTGSDRPDIECHAVVYDVDQTLRAYIRKGACDAAPEICRAAMLTMRTGEPEAVLKLMILSRRLSADRRIDLDVLNAADAAYPWPERISSRDWWQARKEALC